jgi:glutamyl-tRNA synthetase
VKKLQHINAEYLRALPVGEFIERARPFLSGPEVEAVLTPIAPLIQERVRLFTEIEPMVAFLLDGPLTLDDVSWDKAMVKGINAREMVDAAIAGLTQVTEWEVEPIRAAVEAAAVSAGVVNAQGEAQLSKAQGPVRVATTGRSVGPPLFESLAALGQTRTLDRLRAARARL